MTGGAVAAVDLGATSGRVLLGYVSHDELRLTDVARFENSPVRTLDGLHWSVLELYRDPTLDTKPALLEEYVYTNVVLNPGLTDRDV